MIEFELLGDIDIMDALEFDEDCNFYDLDFEVDGIRYVFGQDEVFENPIFESKRDIRCTPDAEGYCDCGYTRMLVRSTPRSLQAANDIFYKSDPVEWNPDLYL